jgi:hypothetical protein
LCFFHFGNAASRCVTQRTLLILPEDFYLTNGYNILGDLVVETKLGLLGLWHVFGQKGECGTSYYASVIPFVDSLIARQSGSYAGQYEGRKNLVRHPNTGFELFQKALPEKLAEKLAEKWASASPQPQPSYPQPTIHNHLSSFFARNLIL